MSATLDQSSVEDLDLALRHYRRLTLRLPAILILGFAAAIGLSRLGVALSPPYGVYVLGWGLGTWGLIGVLLLMFVELWWEGRQIANALSDPEMQGSPIAGLMGGLPLIAERARAMDMEWSGFLGPLRPVRRG